MCNRVSNWYRPESTLDSCKNEQFATRRRDDDGESRYHHQCHSRSWRPCFHPTGRNSRGHGGGWKLEINTAKNTQITNLHSELLAREEKTPTIIKLKCAEKKKRRRRRSNSRHMSSEIILLSSMATRAQSDQRIDLYNVDSHTNQQRWTRKTISANKPQLSSSLSERPRFFATSSTHE